MNIENSINVLHAYLTRQKKDCSFCCNPKTSKFGGVGHFSHVRFCPQCKLMFRWPKQNASFNKFFYQRAYSKYQGDITTELPNSDELRRLKETNFVGSEKDFSNYVELLKMLGANSVLDYGCTWGYATYQFCQGGFDAEGLEISEPRADFGRKNLGVRIFGSTDEIVSLGKKYDCIFTSHVLEHLPTPRIAFDFFDKVSKPGGWLVVEVPNCGGIDARREGVRWGPFSSQVHPLSYTSDFFLSALQEKVEKIHFFSRPFVPAEEIARFNGAPCHDSPDGANLVVLAQWKKL